MEIIEFKEKALPLKNKLFRIARRLLNSYEEAEDALQEVYLKLWEKRNSISDYQSIEAFAVTMIKNQCIDFLRKKSRTFSEIHEESMSIIEINPEKNFDNKEMFEKINNIINQLPENQKLAMQMRDIEGFEIKEIADILQTSIGNVRVILSRARTEVRNILINKYKFNYEKN